MKIPYVVGLIIGTIIYLIPVTLMTRVFLIMLGIPLTIKQCLAAIGLFALAVWFGGNIINISLGDRHDRKRDS